MPALRRTVFRRALVVLVLLVAAGAVYAFQFSRGRQLDPAQLARNNLYQALHALNGVQRNGAQAVDVTPVFSSHLSGLSFADVAQQMNQLGMSWPMSAPPQNSTTTIFLAYGMLKRIPGGNFRPDDRITLSFTVADDGRITVTKASWISHVARS